MRSPKSYNRVGNITIKSMKTLKTFTILSLFLFSNYVYSQFLPAKSTTRPTDFKGIEIEPGTIKFTWEDKSNDETGFLIQINDGLGGYSNYCRAGANDTIVVKKPIENLYWPDYWTEKQFRIIAYIGNPLLLGIIPKATYTTVYAKRPDISINSITLNKSSFASGEVCNSQVSLSNIGNLASKTIKVKYYLSNTSSVSNLIDSVIIAPIDTNQSIIVQRDLKIQSTTYNKKNLIVTVTAGYELSNENNQISKEITVLDPDPKPDLLFESYSIFGNQEVITLEGGTYPKFYNDGQGYFGFTILNKGTSSSEKTDFTVFLSKDKKLSYDDKIISSTNDYIPIILPNFSYGNTGWFWLAYAYNYTTYTGVYWLIGVVDYLDNNDEKNETNNTVVIPIFISGSSSSSIINETKLDNQITSKDFGIKKFKLYPNPCTSNLNIILDNNDYKSVQIIDNTGKVVLNEQVNGRTFINLNISNLNKGLYTVTLSGDISNIYSEKLIIL